MLHEPSKDSFDEPSLEPSIERFWIYSVGELGGRPLISRLVGFVRVWIPDNKKKKLLKHPLEPLNYPLLESFLNPSSTHCI